MSTKNNRVEMNAWALFDTANSAHALVIAAAIFPAYYLNVSNETVDVGGFLIKSSTIYALSISMSYLIVALLSPLLSGIADYGQKRKMFLRIFTYIGSISCIMLYFFEGMNTYWLGVFGFGFSLIGFAGGLVFYNSFLPIIATKDRMDLLSARGFAFGYAGSVLLLLVILWLITNPEKAGLDGAGEASRIGFVMVGVWWILIANITFYFLPKDGKVALSKRALSMGYLKVIQVWKKLKEREYLKRFLLAFFTYSMGVQTVLLLAATFAESEMEFETAELIWLILIIQLVAIIGAYLFAFVSHIAGNKVSLLIQLVIWFIICIAAFLVKEKSDFYLLAGALGMVFGGIQSLSRSTYSKLVASEVKSATSFFSFYDVLEKVAIVVGTLVFGLVSELTGSMRNSTLVLAVFFLIGILILSSIRFPAQPPKSETI
jgi:MFS transporter, UMF1 family